MSFEEIIAQEESYAASARDIMNSQADLYAEEIPIRRRSDSNVYAMSYSQHGAYNWGFSRYKR